MVTRCSPPRRMARPERQRRTMPRRYLETVAPGRPIDFMAEVAVPYPTTVISDMLGVDPARRDDFRRWSEQMVLAVFEPTTAAQRSEVARNGDEMDAYLDEVVAARVESPG